jgi:hypothetical protein
MCRPVKSGEWEPQPRPKQLRTAQTNTTLPTGHTDEQRRAQNQLDSKSLHPPTSDRCEGDEDEPCSTHLDLSSQSRRVQDLSHTLTLYVR